MRWKNYKLAVISLVWLVAPTIAFAQQPAGLARAKCVHARCSGLPLQLPLGVHARRTVDAN